MGDQINKLYFVSASANKFQDYQFLLGKHVDLEWVRLNLEDPVTTDLAVLIRRKIEQARPSLPYLPFLVEQTNLLIKIWKGLPGNVTGLFMKGIGAEGICKMLQAFEDRSAAVMTDLGYHSPERRVSVFRGELNGRLANSPRGDSIFGWDTIFIPEDHQQTFAEMDLEQRNSISTRKLAVTQFLTQVLKEKRAAVMLQTRIRLRDIMVQRLGETEFSQICFDMGIPNEELPSTVYSGRLQDLILYCERRNRLPELLERCRHYNPAVDWPDAL